MLMPKRVKFRRVHRGRMKGKAQRGNTLTYGEYKGAPAYWVSVVKPGRIMFEMNGVSEEIAREAIRLAAMKLPIKCKFVMKEKDGESIED